MVRFFLLFFILPVVAMHPEDDASPPALTPFQKISPAHWDAFERAALEGGKIVLFGALGQRFFLP